MVRRLISSLFFSTVAVLRGDSSVGGTVTFEQTSESGPTKITYHITGNDPSAERGMHVHQFGDNTNGCTSAGPHCTLPPSPSTLPLHHPIPWPRLFGNNRSLDA